LEPQNQQQKQNFSPEPIEVEIVKDDTPKMIQRNSLGGDGRGSQK